MKKFVCLHCGSNEYSSYDNGELCQKCMGKMVEVPSLPLAPKPRRNETERALATLQDLLDNSIFTSRIDFALEVAIEALQDRLKTLNEASDWR